MALTQWVIQFKTAHEEPFEEYLALVNQYLKENKTLSVIPCLFDDIDNEGCTAFDALEDHDMLIIEQLKAMSTMWPVLFWAESMNWEEKLRYYIANGKSECMRSEFHFPPPKSIFYDSCEHSYEVCFTVTVKAYANDSRPKIVQKAMDVLNGDGSPDYYASIRKLRG